MGAKMEEAGRFRDIASDGSPGRLVRYPRSLDEGDSPRRMVYNNRVIPF